MDKIFLLTLVFLLGACVETSAIPMGNNVAEINTSAAPGYTRAQTHDYSLLKAAQTTLEYGYQRFLVLDNKGWNERNSSGGSYNRGESGAIFGANQNIALGGTYEESYGGSYYSTYKNSETSMRIKMLRKGDNDFNNAVDAQMIVDKIGDKLLFKE